MAAPPPSAARASCLSMSGLTLLQITKHCQESMPDIASGVVLGMERAGVLEVTHSFPTPDTGKSDARNTDGDSELPSSSKAADKVDVPKYTMDMLKQLRDVNVDNNNMGWYRSSQGLGGFLDRKFVEAMMVYYRDNAASFVIVFDPWFSRKGSLLLKAFRLRPEFYRAYSAQRFTQATFDALGQSTILEEIPIKVTNSPLANVFLWDLNETLGDAIDCDFDRLNLGANDVLEKQLGFMSSCVDQLVDDQQRIRDQQRKNRGRRRELNRKRAEMEARQRANLAVTPQELAANKIRPPNRLQSLLMSSCINNYCQQINQFTDDSFTRLFLASSVQKD
jgi:translation initiation factor 3 subunit H